MGSTHMEAIFALLVLALGILMAYRHEKQNGVTIIMGYFGNTVFIYSKF